MSPDSDATAATPERVLVVDDEASIRDLVRAALRFSGYEVGVATDGQDALRRVRDLQPDLIVLDVRMPDLDGLEVCRRLRDEGNTCPVVFLTARDAESDRLSGFAVGADDYVTKPFSLDELVARVRAILNRTQARPENASVLTYHDIEMQEDTHRVSRGGRRVELSPTEYKLLRYLLRNPERVLSKLQILENVWEYDFGGDARVVETYVSYLRRKVDTDEPRLIHTVRGFGYVLEAGR